MRTYAQHSTSGELGQKKNRFSLHVTRIHIRKLPFPAKINRDHLRSHSGRFAHDRTRTGGLRPLWGSTTNSRAGRGREVLSSRHGSYEDEPGVQGAIDDDMRRPRLCGRARRSWATNRHRGRSVHVSQEHPHRAGAGPISTTGPAPAACTDSASAASATSSGGRRSNSLRARRRATASGTRASTRGGPARPARSRGSGRRAPRCPPTCCRRSRRPGHRRDTRFSPGPSAPPPPAPAGRGTAPQSGLPAPAEADHAYAAGVAFAEVNREE